MKNLIFILSFTLIFFSCESKCEIDDTAEITIDNNTNDGLSIQFNGSAVGSVSGNKTESFTTDAGPVYVVCTQTSGYLFYPTIWSESVILEACEDIEIDVN